MCPTYDYRCSACSHIFDTFTQYEDRDLLQPCPLCSADSKRGYYTPPQVRTAKTSRTFLDGQRKDVEEFKKIASLQEEQLNHRPDSLRYHEIKSEIMARKSLKPDSGKKYRLEDITSNKSKKDSKSDKNTKSNGEKK